MKTDVSEDIFKCISYLTNKLTEDAKPTVIKLYWRVDPPPPELYFIHRDITEFIENAINR